jgi:NAD(P)-dependent dehydrogenase (short-subunit alcohol dehydrogenase family)
MIVVVGGTSGIGYGVALASLQSQAAKVIVASSRSDNVTDAVKRLESVKANAPGKVEGYQLDAKDFAAIRAFFDKIGEVDHLVWTSGDFSTPITRTGGFREEDLSDIHGMYLYTR